MSEFTITIRGLPAHSTAALRSMLSLLDPALGARWSVVDSGKADVALLPAEAFAAIDSNRDAEALPLLIALGADQSRPPQACALLRKPVTPARLVEALALAEALIGQAAKRRDGLSTMPILQQLDAQRRLAPATLDARVRTALRAATFRLLQTPIAATLIDEARTALYTALPGLGFTTRLTPAEFVGLFRANPSVVLLELAPAEQAALSNAREFRSLRELEWTFWITSRSPWLRPELNAHTRYRLRRWPDFGRLPHYQGDVRMASFLMSQPLTLSELQQRLSLRAETAMNFLNAAFGMGLLVDAAAAPAASAVAQVPQAVRGFGGMIAQLRRKFGLARAPG